MHSPFSFEAPLVLGFLSFLLLSGVLIRAKIPVIQRFLFPSCLIGGVLGSIAVNFGLITISIELLENIAYHFFNLSFISAGLTKDSSATSSNNKGSSFWQGTLWMALTQGVTFPLQAIVGGLVVLLFGLFGIELFQTFGFLAPLGFNEGPGQALSFGKVWEGIGFQHAATIGITFAAIGYAFAFFIGIPLANWGIRKGKVSGETKTLGIDFLKGYYKKEEPGKSAGLQRLHSANIDSLAFQMALVGAIYVMTYFLIDALGTLTGADTAKMLWGFFFFFGLAIAVLVRYLLDKLNIGHLLDSGIQKRITGLSIDFLIVATVPAIQMAVIWKFAAPLFLIAVINGALTTLVVVTLGKQLFELNLERVLAIFGTVTGTVSCGLLLLRIADPEFKTSVAIELAVMNLFVLPIIFGCTLLVNAPLWWNWSLALTLAVFFIVAVVCMGLMRVLLLLTGSKP